MVDASAVRQAVLDFWGFQLGAAWARLITRAHLRAAYDLLCETYGRKWPVMLLPPLESDADGHWFTRLDMPCARSWSAFMGSVKQVEKYYESDQWKEACRLYEAIPDEKALQGKDVSAFHQLLELQNQLNERVGPLTPLLEQLHSSGMQYLIETGGDPTPPTAKEFLQRLIACGVPESSAIELAPVMAASEDGHPPALDTAEAMVESRATDLILGDLWIVRQSLMDSAAERLEGWPSTSSSAEIDEAERQLKAQEDVLSALLGAGVPPHLLPLEPAENDSSDPEEVLLDALRTAAKHLGIKEDFGDLFELAEESEECIQRAQTGEREYLRDIHHFEASIPWDTAPENTSPVSTRAPQARLQQTTSSFSG